MKTLLPDPGADKLAGVKIPETPARNPVNEKATAELKPPLTVTFKVTLLFDPAVTEREFADSAAWNAGTMLPSPQWPTKTDPSMEPSPVA